MPGLRRRIGGARAATREKSRAKERIFSSATRSTAGDPKNQRPELWNLVQHLPHPGASRCGRSLSNWTELDVWLYIPPREHPVPVPTARERLVVERDGALIMVDDGSLQRRATGRANAKAALPHVGCYPLTGAIGNRGLSVEKIIAEMLVATSRNARAG